MQYFVSTAILIQQCTNGPSINEFENNFFLKHSLELKLHALAFILSPHYTFIHYRQLLFEMRQFNFKDLIWSQILPRNLFEIFPLPNVVLKSAVFPTAFAHFALQKRATNDKNVIYANWYNHRKWILTFNENVALVTYDTQLTNSIRIVLIHTYVPAYIT